MQPCQIATETHGIHALRIFPCFSVGFRGDSVRGEYLSSAMNFVTLVNTSICRRPVTNPDRDGMLNTADDIEARFTPQQRLRASR